MLEIPLKDILDLDSLYMNITNLRISDYMDHNPRHYVGGCVME